MYQCRLPNKQFLMVSFRRTFLSAKIICLATYQNICLGLLFSARTGCLPGNSLAPEAAADSPKVLGSHRVASLSLPLSPWPDKCPQAAALDFCCGFFCSSNLSHTAKPPNWLLSCCPVIVAVMNSRISSPNICFWSCLLGCNEKPGCASKVWYHWHKDLEASALFLVQRL